MRARRWKWTGLGVVVLAIVVFSAVWLGSGQRSGPPPRPPVNKAIVALGDSVASGEGAGSYTRDTDGQNGNYCHRSKVAEVMKTKIDHYPFRYNLACSGAKASAITAKGRYGEPAQTEELARIAKQHPVGAIVVTAGANDDPDFSGLLRKCVEATLFSAPCSQGFDKQWQAKVDAMVPKVSRALRGVRDTMRQAGYRDDAYQLIVQSYAAPVGPDMKDQLRDLNGCPITKQDVRWVRGKGVPTLSKGLARAAEQADARFLDMSKAGYGHEACTGKVNQKGKGQRAGGEWFNRLKIDWQDLQFAGRANHSIASSFHPNAAGQRAFAKCLTEFVAGERQRAECVPGQSNDLRLARSEDG